jgi:predicted ATPase
LYFVLADLPRAHTHRVSIAPLTESAVARLARQRGRSAREVHRITGGNPLFVTEVLASDETAIPGTIREAVLARIARLTEGARRVAEIASVVHRTRIVARECRRRAERRRHRRLPADRPAPS